MPYAIYSMCFLLFLTGLYCVAVKKNLIKIAIGIAIMGHAINLFIVLVGYKWGAHAPVIKEGASGWQYVDPLAEAMAIICIIIGLVTLVVFSTISMRLYEKYKTFDITEIKRLKG
jgi:multicomponent Na+:H+ antiporter subunit C